MCAARTASIKIEASTKTRATRTFPLVLPCGPHAVLHTLLYHPQITVSLSIREEATKFATQDATTQKHLPYYVHTVPSHLPAHGTAVIQGPSAREQTQARMGRGIILRRGADRV